MPGHSSIARVCLPLSLVGALSAVPFRSTHVPVAVQITSGTGEWFWPSWSPDGREILAGAKPDSGDWDIRVMRADGSGLRTLGASPATDRHPRWSAAGDFIVFDSNRLTADDVFIIRPDGSDLRRVTTHAASDGAGFPSPDGRQIVFNSDRTGTWQLFVINSDGTGERQIVNRPGGVIVPRWAPDGKKVVFMTNAPKSDVFEVTLDGAAPRALFATDVSEASPRPSPDGKHVLFLRGDGAQRHLVIADWSGAQQRQLTETAGSYSSAEWCPDGKRVVFTRNENGNEDVYVVRIADGLVQRLTDHPARDAVPSCNARGQVVFASERVRQMHLFVVSIPDA